VLYFKSQGGFIGKDSWLGMEASSLFDDLDYPAEWRKLVTDHEFRVVELPDCHYDLLQEPSLSMAAAVIKEVIPLVAR
jgi:hypothetical protein